MKKNLKTFGSIINFRQILIGLSVLIFGTLVYVIDRPPDQTYFVYRSPFNISLFKTLPNLFSHIGNNLPSFIHVFSFILITAGLISCRKKGYLIICISWFLIDCAFEFGCKFNSLVLKIIPDCFSGVPFLENTRNYFFQGTFDVLDLAAVLIGSITGYYVLIVTMKKRKV